MFIAIDPGNSQSGFVVLEDDGKVVTGGVAPNHGLAQNLSHPSLPLDWCVIETVQGMGMPVGREVFETCVWIGRFMELFGALNVDRIYRGDVKLHLCGTKRAKDPHVWQALLDRYGPGKEKAVGKKSAPGPLYGITSHQRAALAVGVCWLDGVRSKVEIESEANQ
jgi:hypothetical protein